MNHTSYPVHGKFIVRRAILHPPSSILAPVSVACALMLAVSTAAAGPRDAQWKQVEKAVQQGLPRTAITNLEPIIAGAIKDRAFAEAVKAIGEKIALEGNIEGNKPEERITRLEAEIARAPKEMVPVMNTLLAHWYWSYFQQNRWRFMQRTATAEAPGKDFTTWDLQRLFAEIDLQFQKALAAESVLKATPIKAWNDLLEVGTMPDELRPTLYDFITHEALEFYTSGEQAGARPEDTFELSADSPIFEASDGFLAWNAGKSARPPTQAPETNSPILRAIQLYQDLLRFHTHDVPPALAFADVDLERLTWGRNTAVGENKNSRYKAALEEFIRQHEGSDLTALAMEREARVLQQEGDPVSALKLAARGADLFSNSPGGKLCHNLVTEIEAKSASISTERVWNCAPSKQGSDIQEGCPEITTTYRNVDAVYFRAILVDWEVFLQKQHNRPESLSDDERRSILRKTPALEWSERLPLTTNYQERTFISPAPTSLKPGFYFIAASHTPSFSEKENLVSMAPVWVSDLAMVTRTRGSAIEGFVLDAESGEPINVAEVSVWHLDYQGNRVADHPLTTDTNGFFSMQTDQNRGHLFRARFQGRELATEGDLWSYNYGGGEPKPDAQTVFFTDRALYRPGQTIQYKGICLWVDQAKDNYEVLKGERLTVVFRDVNGKEVARQEQQANDYGSFAGSFTAPRDRLMGQMSLTTEGRAHGGASVRVEEYKRPKFQVTLDAPKEAPKLSEKTTLAGHAMSYTGAAVDGAQVKFRVVREVRMPWWWGGYGRPWPASESQEIAHGSTTTETDGSFKIEFTAWPDLKVPEKDDPTFEFAVHADVTDSSGETRSSDHSIRVGYTALEAKLSADDWQTADKPVEIKLETKTLDGEPQAARGTVKVYALEAPERPHQASLGGQQPFPRPFRRVRSRGMRPGRSSQPDWSDRSDQSDDLSNPNNWPLGKVVAETPFTTGTNGTATLSFNLASGAYRTVLETQDRFGKKVTGKLPLQIFKPDDSKLAIPIPHLFAAPNWEAQPGQEFMALWGTGYETGRAFIEIEQRGVMIQRGWTDADRTQEQIKLAVTEALRGGFTIHITQVRENRAYNDSRRVEVPWKNKDLEIKWEHFTSKLQPGQKETWTAVIERRADDNTNSPTIQQSNTPERFVAEMVAALYDESLDAFASHDWMHKFSVYREDYTRVQQQSFANSLDSFQYVLGNWERPFEEVTISYRSFPPDLTQRMEGFQYFARKRGFFSGFGSIGGAAAASRPTGTIMSGVPASAAPVENAAGLPETPAADSLTTGGLREAADDEPKAKGPATAPNLSQVSARKNLNETAFFFPQLTSDSNGVVRMSFTLPEALTKWRFLGFAHDTSLRSGFLEEHAVTAKDLMVQPNPPRFLREGDTVEFTVKVSNQSDQPQTGQVRLTFETAGLSGSVSNADMLLGNTRPEQEFQIPARESRSFSWRITVPDGCGFLTYKAVGAAATVSDGEEGALPVLSRRVLVTESLPLPIRGPTTKKFEFTRLLESGKSKTLQNQSLTAQMVSNPAWYAVLALPYLMEYPYECSEQTFNRLYANSLARSIASSDPKIHRIFEAWKNTPALDSPLEKNQDLMSVAIEETPWLREAQSESQARRNVGILFDDNRLNYESDRAMQKLAEMQNPDGSWPWFPGGPRSDYITLYIVTGFGRLRHLGVDIRIDPAVRALPRLDEWMTEEYKDIRKWQKPDEYVPSSTIALYLYGRSFFLKDHAIAGPHRSALEFFLKQSRKYWLKTACRQTQAHLALALNRFNDAEAVSDSTPQDIMKSLKERSVSNEEMGMFWRDAELSWWWYHAPIETQAVMIEAFDEVMHDNQAVEDCKVWLLKQKQTQDWRTTKATADAVYALLLRGRDLLSSDALVELKLGNLDVTPKLNTIENQKSKFENSVEPCTGFYERRFTPSEIKPGMGRITVLKTDQGVAWGSVHWQYFEDINKVTAYEGTPLKLKKELFVKTATQRGPVLEAVKGPVHVGDELVVRIELRTDRDMEFVHLKDQRGSGTEPVNVLSQYRYQDGLGYYESTRDTASHFFIDYLPKGTYVFEYSTRVQLRGQYQSGVAQIQCMYAPEFNSHSESFALTVR